MENAITDISFWKTYWESKTDIVTPIKDKDPFFDLFTQIVTSRQIQSAIELGGFPGYYSVFLKKKLGVDTTLLDFYIHHELLDKFLSINQLEKNDIHRIESDLFSYTPSRMYDMVYSCGLIEHFNDTKEIIAKHIPFVNPNGTLLITLPNLKSVNGWVQKTFDRSNYDKHVIECMDVKKLASIAQNLGLKNVKCYYTDSFSVWLENKQEQNFLNKVLVKTIWLGGKILHRIFRFKGEKTSPYIVLIAQR